MIDPGRALAGWFGRAVILYLGALLVLVVVDISRDENSHVRAKFRAMFPDAGLVQEMQTAQRNLEAQQHALVVRVNAQLQTAHLRSESQLGDWIKDLDRQIAEKTANRLSPGQKIVAALTGRGLVAGARNEFELELLILQRAQILNVLQGAITLRTDSLGESARQFVQAHKQYTALAVRHKQTSQQLAVFAMRHPVASVVPFEEFQIADPTRLAYLKLARQENALATAVDQAWFASESARKRWKIRKAMRVTTAAPLANPQVPEMQELQSFIDAKQASVDAQKAQFRELTDLARTKGWQALGWVIALLLLPFVLKAFWYYFMAPLAVRRPPIRLRPTASAPVTLDATVPAGSQPPGKVSAVSQVVRLASGEELLVHPEYLQSSSERGHKQTKWLLNTRYPVTSISSGMVALTRARGDGETYTVSSRNDPFAEVGLIELREDTALVLQPRNLVGLVQPSRHPIRITSCWRFGLSAVITLQFRYLVFEGPGKLLVRGCRGVMLERADTGRAIDQNATIGFSANLAYAPRRSETFGAYLMGVNGLFNDGFAGGTGIFVYEEMPYYGKKAGITGRGLEGVTDLFLKLFGI